jgi:subtilisin family serine protease
VGAATQQNVRASYSNYGSTNVDISAPGTVIGLVSRNNQSVYVSVSGTSFSAPLVAGAVALIKGAKPELTPAEIKKCLMDASTPGSASLMTVTDGILDVDAAAKMCVDGIMPSNPRPGPKPRVGSVGALGAWCAIMISVL